MLVSELEERLSLSEMAEWQRYYKWKKKQHKKEAKKAKNKGRSSI